MSSYEGTWAQFHHDSSAAPQTVQTASPVCGTKNFSSVRLYSAPQAFRTTGISAAGNGTSCVRLETDPHRCFGSHPAQLGFAVGKPGAGRSPINRNSTMRQIELTLERLGSTRGCALLADLILTIGIF